MSPFVSRLKAFFVPIAVVLVGASIFAALRMTRPRPESKEVKEHPLVVDVQKTMAEDRSIIIEAQGTTIAAQKVEIQSQVSGRIVWKSQSLLPGGHLAKGAPLVRVDDRDYQIAQSQQEASVGKARLDLQLESGRKKVAEREWALLKKQQSGKNTLALREPQYAAAKMGLQAAESGLERAKLNLDRTTLRAPFSGFVQRQNTDVGQLVTPQMSLGTFVGSDRFWVMVKVPTHKLGWINFPKGDNEGSQVEIWQQRGDQRVVRNGRVLQLAGDLDPAGRMAQILVEVEDPLGLKQVEPTQPILLGSFVNIDIVGKTMTNAIEVPRRAVQEGSQLLIMDNESRLEIRNVTIEWRSKNFVYVSAGLEAGELVVISRIHRPIGGTLLQAMQPAPTTPTAKAPDASGDSK